MAAGALPVKAPSASFKVRPRAPGEATTKPLSRAAAMVLGLPALGPWVAACAVPGLAGM